MSEQILINPEGFYPEIDNLSAAQALITDEMFSIDKGELALDTISELDNLVKELNSLYVLYREHLGRDVKNLNVIIAEWMKVDTSLAGKNLFEGD
ncbi:hypothetical protein ACTGZQ_10960 [Streptococcus suis]